MGAENDNINGIDLARLVSGMLKALKSVWPAALALVLLAAAAVSLRAWRAFTPLYESEAVFTVNSGYSRDDILSYSYYYDNEAANQLAAAFPSMLKTDVMRELVTQQLGTDTINGTVTAESVADTNLFVLRVRSRDAKTAHDILCAVIDSYPQVASYMVEYCQVVIRSSPTMPDGPCNSFSWPRQLAKGALLGAAAALVLVMLIAASRKTFCTTDDVKMCLSVPVLAGVPETHVKRRRSRDARPDILAAGADRGFIEAVKKLRLRVCADTARVVMVTSTVPGEGKTTIAVNLALSIAQTGKRTLLVNADLRKAEELPDAGDADGGAASWPGSSLKVLHGEEYTAKGGAGMQRLGRAINKLREDYDYIIVDTPPSGIISDAKFLCRYTDGVLYVIRRDLAPRRQVIDALDSLHAQNAKLIGCVLNGTAPTAQGYGYGKYGRYGYGYGKYGYGKKREAAKRD